MSSKTAKTVRQIPRKIVIVAYDNVKLMDSGDVSRRECGPFNEERDSSRHTHLNCCRYQQKLAEDRSNRHFGSGNSLTVGH
jgi:hypothetical protein